MNDLPLVSVIIPVFNRKNMLSEAVYSVINQSFKNWELIITDDASDDGTAETAQELSELDSRIKVLVLDRHLGKPGAVRNRGTELAKGKYLAFLDSDDLWKADKLEKQMKFFASGPRRFVHTGEVWLRNGKVVSQTFRKHRREGDIFSDALEKCIIGPSTVIMEKSLFLEVNKFSETLEICEDYHLWLKITSKVSVGYLSDDLTIKQAGKWEQLSTKYGQIEIFHIKALLELLEQKYFQGRYLIETEKMLAEKCRIYACGCRKRNRNDEAVFYENIAEQYFNH